MLKAELRARDMIRPAGEVADAIVAEIIGL
jgi:hypothetical protein